MTLEFSIEPPEADARTVREYQRGCILEFLNSVSDVFRDQRVLDYGCGDQPYRPIVEEADCQSYTPFNRSNYPGTPHRVDLGPEQPLEKAWDVILCTQMLQYVPTPVDLLVEMAASLTRRHSFKGQLVLTFATNWPEIETEDMFRFTMSGMLHLLWNTGFLVKKRVTLGTLRVADFVLPLGGGIVAQAK